MCIQTNEIKAYTSILLTATKEDSKVKSIIEITVTINW